MRAFTAFLKKELLECIRSGKILILGILFVVFGIMNPAIAKLTPWLFELLSEDLAENGMAVTQVSVDALTSWTQFFKNIPMALIAFLLIMGGIFTREYETGTLVLLLTKGLSRYKVILAKGAVMMLLWTAGYWVCFGITYGYNAYFWDNSIAEQLIRATVYWWCFGIFTVTLTVLFSVLAKGYSGVLLGVGGAVLFSYLLGCLPKASAYVPTSLMNGMTFLTGAETVGEYLPALIITLLLSAACMTVSIPIFNKKQL